jgi:Uma2 family endonuclease
MATLPVASEQNEWIDDSRYERVNGQLRERSVPGFEHTTVQQACIDVLRPIAKSFGAAVRSEWSLSDGHGNWLTPDVMLALPGFRRAENGHLLPPPPPHLVIEVISYRQDLEELISKAEEYKSYGVPYYWILNPYKRRCYQILMNRPELVCVQQTGELEADMIRLSAAEIWAAYDAVDAPGQAI